jgi:hypothetical protein
MEFNLKIKCIMKEKMNNQQILDLLNNLKYGFQIRFNDEGKISWIKIEEIGKDNISEICDLLQPTDVRTELILGEDEDVELFLY